MRGTARSTSVDGALAVSLCDRRRGIGADGLIHGAAPSAEQAADGIDVVMHLFNSDGSRAEISGNGIRCLAQAVARERGETETVVVAATDTGRRTLVVTPPTTRRRAGCAVDMGAPRPGPDVPEPVAESLTVRHGTVDMGNPHLVVVVDDPADVDLATEGPWLEAQFPSGVNVEYIVVTPDRSTIDLRVRERGAGITEACGSGACAAAHLASRWGSSTTTSSSPCPGARPRSSCTTASPPSSARPCSSPTSISWPRGCGHDRSRPSPGRPLRRRGRRLRAARAVDFVTQPFDQEVGDDPAAAGPASPRRARRWA